MSGYNIEYFIKDFANRTNYNLEYIDSRADKYGPYEVTQLINSLLGLIILPVEEYKNRTMRPQKEHTELYEKTKNNIKDIMSSCELDSRYRCTYRNKDDPMSFIKHIKNALSHAGQEGLHFFPLSDEGENVTGMVFYDYLKNDNDGYAEFCVKLYINELRELAKYTTTLYSTLEIKDGKRKRYEYVVEQMNLFMNGSLSEPVISLVNKYHPK